MIFSNFSPIKKKLDAVKFDDFSPQHKVHGSNVREGENSRPNWNSN